jgi:hypothetical protein
MSGTLLSVVVSSSSSDPGTSLPTIEESSLSYFFHNEVEFDLLSFHDSHDVTTSSGISASRYDS